MQQLDFKSKLEMIKVSAVPFAEDHPLFNLFLARRKIAVTILMNMLTEEDYKTKVEQFNYVEEQIKKYLYL